MDLISCNLLVSCFAICLLSDEEPIALKKMQDFCTVDGFAEITENLADMIKSVANEPSVGFFYVQLHIQNAALNLINLKNNVTEKSNDTALHTEDLEDSITMLSSMKECGFPIADEMIRDIKKSLSIISTKQPKRGLLHNSGTGFLGRTSSWSPASWGRNTVYAPQEGQKSSGYLSSVFSKIPKQRTDDLRWPHGDSRGAGAVESLLTAKEETEEVDRERKEESLLSKSLPDNILSPCMRIMMSLRMIKKQNWKNGWERQAMRITLCRKSWINNLVVMNWLH